MEEALSKGRPQIFNTDQGSPDEARKGIGAYLAFYNQERPHQALGYRNCFRKGI